MGACCRSTFPITISPRASTGHPARSTAAFITAVISTSGAVSLNDPRFALQMGVRTAEQITTSSGERPSEEVGLTRTPVTPRCCPCSGARWAARRSTRCMLLIVNWYHSIFVVKLRVSRACCVEELFVLWGWCVRLTWPCWFKLSRAQDALFHFVKNEELKNWNQYFLRRSDPFHHSFVVMLFCG